MAEEDFKSVSRSDYRALQDELRAYRGAWNQLKIFVDGNQRLSSISSGMDDMGAVKFQMIKIEQAIRK